MEEKDIKEIGRDVNFMWFIKRKESSRCLFWAKKRLYGGGGGAGNGCFCPEEEYVS